VLILKLGMTYFDMDLGLCSTKPPRDPPTARTLPQSPSPSELFSFESETLTNRGVIIAHGNRRTCKYPAADICTLLGCSL
jgi:hypothetical protein